MRGELWNALRRVDLTRSAALLSEEIQRDGLDEHLMLAAFELEHLSGAPLPLPWRELCAAAPLDDLYSVVDLFYRCQWPAVLEARARLEGTLDDSKAAVLAAFAIRSARAVGDAAAARDIAREAITRHPGNPLLLYQALRLELESPFLDCPDLLAVDLATRSQSQDSRMFLDPAWTAVARAVLAWLNHRDDDRVQAKADLEVFLRLSGSRPIDIALGVPFLEKLEPELAANILRQSLPFSAPVFLEIHLRYGQLTGEQRSGVLQEALARVPHHPLFRLHAALQGIPPQGGGRIPGQLVHLVDELPWYQLGLRTGIQVGINLRDGAWTLRNAFALLERCSSTPEAFDWIVENLEGSGWYEAIGHAMAGIIQLAAWWKPGMRSRDERALGLLTQTYRSDEIIAFLNRRAQEIADEKDEDDLIRLLMSRGGRMALESLTEFDRLSPAAAFAGAYASVALGLIPLARNLLATLQGRLGPDDPRRFRSVRLLELCEVLPEIRSSHRDVDLLERYLSLIADLGVDEFLVGLEQNDLRLLQGGRPHQAIRLLRAAIGKLPQPEVLEMAAWIALRDLKDPGLALSLLEEYPELAGQTPEVWRTRCMALEKLGRTQDWLRTAREGRERFPDRAELLIEEGLALAIVGDIPASLDLLHLGLQQEPDDERGLERYRSLAPRYEQHERLLAILAAALERNPDDTGRRDALIQLLGSLEDRVRERLLHLYQRAHLFGRSDDATRRKELFGALAAIRQRLVAPASEASPQIEGFAALHGDRVRAALRELRPITENRVLAAVFSELAVASPSGEGIQTAPGLTVVLQTRGALVAVAEGARSVIRGVLEAHDYKDLVDVLELPELWKQLRREDRSRLDLLLTGLPVDDFALLNALRMIEHHRKLILERLGDYVVCYVVAGSFVRGTQRIASDIDVWIVVDDSDIKAMSRETLQERLWAISDEYRVQSRSMFAMSRELHVQTQILSSFWQSLQSVDPVIVSMLRDGVPLYDRGLFNAWARLLGEGHLRSTRENLDAQVKTVESLRGEALQQSRILAEYLQKPIKYGSIKMLEVLLQALDLPVGHYREVIELAGEEIVRRRGLLSEDDLEVARQAVAFVKAVETGTIPAAEEALQLFRSVEGFIEKARAVYRQLIAEQDRATLEEIVPRIDSVLRLQPAAGMDGARYWSERLTRYRDEARRVLDADDRAGLAPMRIGALVDRLPEVALSIKLLESQQE